MDAISRRCEVHGLPLIATDAVLQICRHLKMAIPYQGVNIRIVEKTECERWARIKFVGRNCFFTLRIVAYQGVTEAIYHTSTKNYFFTLNSGENLNYQITQQDTLPFTHNPFSAEDFYRNVDEQIHHAQDAEAFYRAQDEYPPCA